MESVDRRQFLVLGGASLLALTSPGGQSGSVQMAAGWSGATQELGTPVAIGLLHGDRVGPDDNGVYGWVYLVFAQATGNQPFLIVFRPDLGTLRQVFPPSSIEVTGFKCLYPGSDNRVYVGTYNRARLMRFDPARSGAGQTEDLGELPNASMVWWIREAADGRFYMTTSDNDGGGRLVSWDPRGGMMRDHGRLSAENLYATHLVTSLDRWTLYIAVGPQRWDVVSYDIRTGSTRGLLPESKRDVGFIGLQPGTGGMLEAELPSGERVPITPAVRVDMGPSPHTLADGRIESADAETIKLSGPQGTTAYPMRYKAATEVFFLRTDPFGQVYGFTRAPVRLCRFDSSSRVLSSMPNPFIDADGSVSACANWGSRVIFGGYPGSEISVYDPRKPWNKGSTPQSNPWTWGKPDGEGHTHPTAIVVGADGRVYVGSDASYGVSGGAVACMDATTGRTIYNLRGPFADRSVRALAAHPGAAAIFVGTGIAASEASRPGASAHVVAWDATRQRLLWDVTPVTGATHVTALYVIGGRVCGTTMSGYEVSHFFVLDPKTGRTILVQNTGLGGIEHGNLLPGPDGWLYGLTYVKPTIFRINPSDGTVETIADVSHAQGNAFAVTSEGFYYANRGTLFRIQLDNRIEYGRSR